MSDISPMEEAARNKAETKLDLEIEKLGLEVAKLKGEVKDQRPERIRKTMAIVAGSLIAAFAGANTFHNWIGGTHDRAQAAHQAGSGSDTAPGAQRSAP